MCQNHIKIKTSSGSSSDSDVDEAPHVGQFVAVEVDQEDGGAGLAGTELDAGLGFLSGAHVADPAKRRGTWTLTQRPTAEGPEVISERTCV